MLYIIFLFSQGCDTWVLSDYSATSSNEITVQRGQQVEVLEPSSSSTSMILVRLYGQKEEGLVPQSCLKQPTGGFKYRNARDEGKLSFIYSLILTLNDVIPILGLTNTYTTYYIWNNECD